MPQPSEEAHILFSGRLALGSAWLSLSSRPYTLIVRIHGTKASLLADVVHDVIVVYGRRLSSRNRLRRTPPNPGHHALLARLYESLSAGNRVPVTGELGRDVVAVLDRLWTTIERVGAER